MDKIKLGDLCIPSAGQIKEDADELIDYIDISSVDNETKKVTGFQTMSFGESPSRARKAVKKGNILVSTVRPNLNAVAMLEEDTPNISVASTGFCILDCKNNVDNRFVFNFCKSKTFIDDMVSQATGASYPAVSDKIVRSALVPNYTYEEQCNISEILDKVSKVIEDRKAEILALDELIKARFVELFVEKGYPQKTVHDILEAGFWLMPATPQYIDDGEVPYITSKNIKNRQIDFENVKYISTEAFENISANRPTDVGDILVSMIGTLGQTAVISDDRKFYGQNLYLLRLNKKIIVTEYFCEFFNADETQHILQGKCNQSTQAYLKANHVEDLKLPVPPIEEQEKFAYFVKQVDKSKVAVQKALDETQTLFDSLMQQYFG